MHILPCSTKKDFSFWTNQSKQEGCILRTLLLIWDVGKYLGFTELLTSTEPFLKTGPLVLSVGGFTALFEVLPVSENAIRPQYRICFLNIIRKEEKHPQQWKETTKKVLSIISAEDQKNLSVMRLRTKYLSAMFCPHCLFIWFQIHVMVFHPDYF